MNPRQLAILQQMQLAKKKKKKGKPLAAYPQPVFVGRGKR